MLDDAPQPSEVVERLLKKLQSASQGDRMYERPMEWSEADQLLAYIAKLQADGDKLAGALEPFSLVVDDLDERDRSHDDIWEHHVGLDITKGDLRRARQALTEWKDRA